MSAKRDYYEVLGVQRTADESAMKRAYRKFAKKYHPDTNAGDAKAEEKFKEVTEAYNILSDPQKRTLYDRFGHAAFDGTGAQGGSESSSYSYNYSEPQGFDGASFHFGGDDDLFGDWFEDLFGKGGGHYSYRFHGDGFRNQNFRRKGSDLRAQVSVTFEEAALGCEKGIRLTNPDGSAQTLKVRIPAGIDTGQSIRLSGKGNPGTGGGAPGDLLLKVEVGEKPGFERKGMDLYTSITVPFSTAVLGGEAVVPTLYGKVICRIREGTQSGSRIRLKGKGIVSMKDPSLRGDQYVKVEISVPKNVSPEAKAKLREFDRLCGRGQTAGRGHAA